MPSDQRASRRDKLLANLLEVDKSLRRSYLVQGAFCLLFLYLFYGSVVARNEVARLEGLAAQARCVQLQLEHAGNYLAELTGPRRTVYTRYAKTVQSVGDALAKQAGDPGTPRARVMFALMSENLLAYGRSVELALATADAAKTDPDLTLSQLAAVVRPLRPISESVFLESAPGVPPVEFLKAGRLSSFADVLPPSRFVRLSCAADSIRGDVGATDHGTVERRLAAIEGMSLYLGDAKVGTASKVETDARKLEEQRRDKARTLSGATVKIPLVDHAIEVSVALAASPLALLLMTLLIAGYTRHRYDIVEAVTATLDRHNGDDFQIRENLHLYLLPWVGNFPYLEADRFRHDRPRDSALARGLLALFQFLPVVTLTIILARPAYVVAQKERFEQTPVAVLDVLIWLSSVVILWLTWRQVMYARRLERRIAGALGWTAPSPAREAAVPVEVRRAGWLLYVLLALGALLGNWTFALTPSFHIDLTTVAPILVLVAGIRFGAAPGAALGAVTAGVWVIGRLLGEGITPGLLLNRYAVGPLSIPQSSVIDVIRLALLGGLAGWMFARVRETAGNEWPVIVEAWRRSVVIHPSGLRTWLRILAGVVAILCFNVVVRTGPGLDPERRLGLFPLSSLAVLACAAVGWWLGARRGALAGAVAIAMSVVAHPWVSGPFGVRLEFHALGHIVSFALLGYWIGRVRGFASQSDALDATRRRLPEAVSSITARSSWLLVPSLALVSLAFGILSAADTWINIVLPPLVVAAVMLTGMRWGARRAVWQVGVVLGALALLAHLARFWGWIWSTDVAAVRITAALTLRSAATVGVLTVVAWVSGRIDLAESRRNRYAVAIAAVAALEVVSVLRWGTFLIPSVNGAIGGVRIDLLTTLARLLEPWLTVILVEAGLRWLRRAR